MAVCFTLYCPFQKIPRRNNAPLSSPPLLSLGWAYSLVAEPSQLTEPASFTCLSGLPGDLGSAPTLPLSPRRQDTSPRSHMAPAAPFPMQGEGALSAVNRGPVSSPKKGGNPLGSGTLPTTRRGSAEPFTPEKKEKHLPH